MYSSSKSTQSYKTSIIPHFTSGEPEAPGVCFFFKGTYSRSNNKQMESQNFNLSSLDPESMLFKFFCLMIIQLFLTLNLWKNHIEPLPPHPARFLYLLTYWLITKANQKGSNMVNGNYIYHIYISIHVSPFPPQKRGSGARRELII